MSFLSALEQQFSTLAESFSLGINCYFTRSVAKAYVLISLIEFMKNANDNTWKGGFNADTHKEEKTE